MPLETERLILDAWRTSDWTRFRPMAQDPEVMRYITGGDPWTEEQIRNFVDRQINLFTDRGFCRWRLVERATGEFIGFCGAGFWRDYPDAEIGWWLTPSHWGRGLATEAARCALRDAFERVGLERIVSVARVENVRSRRVMEKLGLHPQCEFAHEGVRLVRYEILHAEYCGQASV